MRVIRLNGELGKKYGRIHRLDVRTPAEAVKALIINFPEMRNDLAASEERGVGYRCIVDRVTIGEDMLGLPMSKSFSLTPVLVGAGKVGQIIIGIIILAAAIYFAPLTAGGSLNLGATAFSVAGMTVSYGAIAMIGVAMTLGGIAQLLAPTPKMGSSAQKNENGTFDGPVNTIAQGVPVPVGYGRMTVGSAVISAGITVQQPAYSDYGMTGFQRVGP